MIYPLDSDLLPWIYADELRQIERDKGWKKDERARCKDEPWYWLVNYVYTIRKDEFTENAQPEVMRFPAKKHLQVVFEKCFREPFLLEDKSRQMTLSWIHMAYYDWRLTFGEHEEIVVQTKKEVDAAALVQRADFMLKSVRSWLRPIGYDPRRSFTEGRGGRIRIGALGNTLTGLPGGQGAGDQIRSKNPSRYFLDEAGFVEEFEECIAAAQACCQDIKVVSTANAGPFSDFVHDLRKAG